MKTSNWNKELTTMDSQKTIKQFIQPNIIPGIIMLLIPPFFTVIGLLVLLCAVLPANKRMKKNLAKLESLGKLDQAAAELTSSDAKHYVNGKLILTPHFIFCKLNGMVFTYDEIVWAYRHRFTQRCFFIPIKVTDSLYLATKDIKPTGVASMGKDKTEQIRNAILEIHARNARCMIGYSNENVAAYKKINK